MPYTVQLDLDAGTNAALDALATELDRIPGLETVRAIGDVHHLSLAVYDALDVAPFLAELDRFAETIGPIPVVQAALGLFTKPGGVLFVAPVVTEPLLALHRRFHAAMAKWLDACSAHYRPPHWMPHITLAMATEDGGLDRAVPIARRLWQPGGARLDAVRLIRFRPVETLYLRSLV